LYDRPAVALKMVRIAGTWFTMGSEQEPPLRRVWVDAFEIGACQVTNAEYAEFAPPPLGNDPNFNHPDQPVAGVSWFDAVAYCEWRGVRLPTEAEWECAARGGVEGKLYPWGDELPPSAAMAGPDRVRLGAPNGYGLYDMCTNVHEWCSDWYSPTRRASRGGSWRHAVTVSRCAARSSLPPDFRYSDYGFRVARSTK
jgi:formylglycine-generating enzyme required for sulfatase activity